MKWNIISTHVMNVGCSNQLKNEVVHKDKWGFLVGDFKKIKHALETTKTIGP
jgi:hypothetical protein